MTASPRVVKVKGPSLFPLQQEIANHPARFKVVLGGRRFGKTRVGASIALKTTINRKAATNVIETIKRGGLVWWVAPVYSQSEIVFQLLEPLIRKIPGARIIESKLCFKLPNGGSLWCKSADRPDRLRGRGVHGLVIDEADFIDGSLWSKVLRPALSDHKGWALFLSSPNKRNGWFHKLFKLGQSGTNPQWKSWHCPSSANPYLDPQEIEDAKLDMTEEEHRQEYGAEYVDSHELVYFNFNEDFHVKPCPLRPGVPIRIGLDFNNKPRVAVLVQREGDVFRVVGELHHSAPATTEQHAAMVSGWLKGKGYKQNEQKKWGKGFVCYPDASGKALRQGGGTNIEDFEAAGFLLDYPAANPHIVDRDNIVLAHFKNAEGRVRLFIDPSCVHLIAALKELKHKGREGSQWGHILDALGYLIHRIITMEKQSQGPIVASATVSADPRSRGRALPRAI